MRCRSPSLCSSDSSCLQELPINRFGLPGIEAGYRNRIKKCITGQDEPAALKPLCCQSGNSVDLFCYSPEPFGAVIDSIKACNHRQQDLRSEEHTSELQSRGHLVCRLLLEKKK